MKKLTYKDWYCGDVTLEYARCIFNEDSKPKLVSWSDFSDEDIIEIKKKQKEIFQDIVNLKLDKLKAHFEEIYSRSQIKDELLEMEKRECINILYSPIPRGHKIVSKNWKVLFDIDDLLEIQNYFKNTILGGNNWNFEFVQSPNDKYQDNSKTLSQAYAQLLFDYFKWLEKEFKSLDEKDEKSDNNHNVEPKNNYPSIFKNGYAFDFFKKLKEFTVSNNTQVADYAFIFHKMKKAEFILDVKHKTFIKMLNDDFDASIYEIKFPFKDQIKKQLIYSTLLKEYEGLI